MKTELFIITSIITIYIITCIFSVIPQNIYHKSYHYFMSPKGLLVMVFITFSTTVSSLIHIILNVDNPEKWLLIISVGIAISGFFFNSAVKLNSEIRERTYKQYIALGNNKFPEKSSYYWKFRRTVDVKSISCYDIQFILAEGDLISAHYAKLLSKYFKSTLFYKVEELIKLKGSILYTANYFEELAIAVRHNDLSEATVKEYFKGMLQQFWLSFEPFLFVIRNENEEFKFTGLNYNINERSDSFENLEWLANRWVEKN